ncbi:MAG: hypothetical protein IJR47_04090, partial [Clostridia bacterium]|nr:hypothetical protein [Clostridia bacterium]
MDNKIKELYNDINQNEQKSRKFRIAIATLNGVLVYCLIVYALLPQKLDIQIGSTMPQTVYATKTVEDTVSTNEVKERVADQVPFQYTASEKVKQQQLDGFRSYYSAIINARNYAYENSSTNDNGNISITNGVLNQANNQFNTELTMEQMNAVIAETQGDLLNYFKQADTELNNALTNGIYEGDVSKTREEIVKIIPSNKSVILNLVNTGLRKNMAANMLYDEQATATERAKALENVEAIYYPKGRAIAYKGEVVTESQFEMLNALGFVGNGISFDWQTIIGAAVLIVALYLFYYFYIYNYNNYVFGRLKYFALSSSVITITLAFCVLAMNFKEYLMPISLAGLLTVALINRKVALLNNIIVCGLVAIIQRNSWTFYSVFAYIISTMAGIYLFDKNKTRFGILL